MTKNEDNIKDLRSTGRRRARLELFKSMTPFVCIDCKHTTRVPPADAPTWFYEIWPEENRTLTQLQADHESKDLLDNDISMINWRCPSCHKLHDNKTEKGESTIKQNYF